MADIQPFKGWRYDLNKVGELARVIAPPYDVIDESLSDSLYAQSPYNVIRLELEKEKPTDNESENRYSRSTKYLRDWQSQAVLVQEDKPAFYLYNQTFEWEGKTFCRRGFMARVRLEPFGEGSIYPHEQTMSGPKADRLKLFHSTGMNISPIFGLFPDDKNAMSPILDRLTSSKKPLEATDHLGVKHSLWVIDDPKSIAELQTLLKDKPVFIADGHHRYETSLKHLEEREKAGHVAGPDAPERFTLMMFVGMADPGLQVMPTHRLVSGVGSISHTDLQEKLSPYFDVEVVGEGEGAGRETWDRVVASGQQGAIGLHTASTGKWVFVKLRDQKAMNDVVPDRSDVYRSLGVSILHRLILEKCLGAPAARCRYVHLTSEVFDAIKDKSCELACLVQPATVDHIRQLSGTFETMPAKSTYFYPKLATGLVMNPIHRD